ncbi:MAG TPA: 4-(cytidine 5'-diphospho)-2-C-methyl-D-erythritol kinase [Rhizomicrobium sp.]
MGAPETLFAPAKINLYLHVGEKRPDGYHELDSLVVFADVGDELRIADGERLQFRADGPFAPKLGNDTDNLVLRAAETLARHAGVAPNAHMALTKNLPVASGIGGGSADAAAALRGLKRLWNLDIADAELKAIALSLGADVPACLLCEPLRLEGRGETIVPMPDFPSLDLVLVNPGVALSTPEVFSRLETRTGTNSPIRPFHDRNALIAQLERSTNDLEAPAKALCPQIREVIDALCSDPSSYVVRMSGSGATCFGIFDSAEDARVAAATIADAHPDWWVRAVKTGG